MLRHIFQKHISLSYAHVFFILSLLHNLPWEPNLSQDFMSGKAYRWDHSQNAGLVTSYLARALIGNDLTLGPYTTHKVCHFWTVWSSGDLILRNSSSRVSAHQFGFCSWEWIHCESWQCVCHQYWDCWLGLWCAIGLLSHQCSLWMRDEIFGYLWSSGYWPECFCNFERQLPATPHNVKEGFISGCWESCIILNAAQILW